MVMSKGHVGCFFLMLLSVSVFSSHGVLGARFLKEDTEIPQKYNWKEGGNHSNNNEGGVDAVLDAIINRPVPASPDPLHNGSHNSASVFTHGVLGGRYLKEKVRSMEKLRKYLKDQSLSYSYKAADDASTDRKVPSSPNPIHNRPSPEGLHKRDVKQ